MLSRRHFLQLAGLAALPSTAWEAAAAPSLDTLKFVFSRPYDNPRTQWLIHVYQEICGRLGKGFEFVEVPAKRATAMVLAGEVDGELGRTYEYLLEFPTLVRIAEANNQVNFAAYAARAEVEFKAWPAVRERNYFCEYRLGIQELESLLAKQLAPANVSAVRTIAQGLRKLQLGRADLYFDVEEAVSDFFYIGDEASELPADPAVHQVAIVQSTTGHAYLHPSRANLADAMSANLRQMKRNGLVHQYLTEALATYKRQHASGPQGPPA